MSLQVVVLIGALIVVASYQFAAEAKFDFPAVHSDLNRNERDYLDSITPDEWKHFSELGSESIDAHKRLEENIIKSQITIENGSISHEQLLDSLPDAAAKENSDIAIKILKSAMYVYNSKCAVRGISALNCEAYLAEKQLPAGSDLHEKCTKIVRKNRNGHHSFRRLLPRNYRDGLYELYAEDKLPAPRLISLKALENSDSMQLNQDLLDENKRNLAFVQWAQFIEHDLSKPVVTSMSDGTPIECCVRDHFKLQPRLTHPACAPLLGVDTVNKHGRETCLNYVRSALTVGSKCTFASAEQHNQATGYFDLSQLYGFTDQAQRKMRSLKSGKIRSTSNALLHRELLPVVTDDRAHTFCALTFQRTNDSVCFMAGDSRVNSNPFSIVIYTVFMRNHNRIARALESKHPGWNDERLYTVAKAININVYRRVILTEWLPEVLGETIFKTLNAESVGTAQRGQPSNNWQISNEFAVAAIRFYFSMMPNELHDLTATVQRERKVVAPLENNNILSETDIFVLKDEIYKPHLAYTSKKLNDILESVLNQRAMKMDYSYVESLISDYRRPTHADIFAYDIQRGRDHGLQGYVQYLEICNDVKVNSWQDLEAYISNEDITKLKQVYSKWSDIDLIVGGIAEIPRNGAVIGPTFACILAEQFTKIRQWQQLLPPTVEESNELPQYKTATAADILCANSELKYVPTNIFKLGSTRNPTVSCAQRLKTLQL